jgi:hypothetical protein
MSAERGLNGWLVIDKPAGITSSQVVVRVRRATGMKAGHAGTLDPLATGILPVALGEATKTVSFISKAIKRYSFRICWGVARDTDDSEGEITATSLVRPEATAIMAELPRFLGTILQRPPAYSAIKVAGRRAYALARAGKPALLAKAPTSPPWPATLPRRLARSAISPRCAASRSAASAKPRQFRWIWRPPLGIVCSLPGIYCRSRLRWTTSRPWP